MTTTTSNTVYSSYSLNFDQCHDLALAIGPKRTVLFQGCMGIGKSALYHSLCAALPDHVGVLIDGTTMVDSADLFMISIEGKEFERVPLKRLNMLGGKPIILFVDELGKMSRSAQLATRRLLLERAFDDYELPKGSIAVATTNLAGENVGDLLPAHARNSMLIVNMANPTAKEWVNNFAISNGIHEACISYVLENPQVFHSFMDYEDPNENQHIFHPRANRESFCSHRAMHMASDVLKERDHMDNKTLHAALIGAIGQYTANDMMAHIALCDQIPKRADIHSNPMTAVVPTDPAAICMVVYRELVTIEREHVTAWMQYMGRLSKEAQGLFINGIRDLVSNNKTRTAKGEERHQAVCQNAEYRTWCHANGYMIAQKN